MPANELKPIRSDEEKAAAAKALNDRQRALDKAHHESRVQWLTTEPCLWGDGSRMAEHDRLILLNGSNECLRLINEHGMSTNSASLDVSEEAQHG